MEPGAGDAGKREAEDAQLRRSGAILRDCIVNAANHILKELQQGCCAIHDFDVLLGHRSDSGVEGRVAIHLNGGRGKPGRDTSTNLSAEAYLHVLGNSLTCETTS